MKKLLTLLAILIISVIALASCDILDGPKEDVITVEDGYLVVNGVKTEYEVKTDDVIEIIDGYLVVNGVKTEYYFIECNHIWTSSTVAPTCSKVGYDLNLCAICGKAVKSNETSTIDHTFSTEYSSDSTYHWHSCINCTAEKDKAEHQSSEEGMCTVCNQPVGITVGIIYDISEDGTYAIVAGYSGTSDKVRIADTYEGLPVKAIFDNAFRANQTITSVIIPDSVTEIGAYVFYNCDSLASVSLGNSVATIGEAALQNCGALSSIIIPSSVTTIGNEAISYCSKIKSLVIPDSVKTIGNAAFEYCSNLTSVVIGNGVTSIGKRAFFHCTKMTSIVMGDNVTNIGEEIFTYCDKLPFNEYQNCKYLEGRNNPYYFLIEGSNKNMTGYTLHEDTKIISGGAFAECSRLASIVIPDGVTSIGKSAFSQCKSLTSVTIPDSVTTIGDYAFYYCSSLTSIALGKGVATIGKNAFHYCSSLTSIVIPKSVTTIGVYAFQYCSGLKNVYYTGSEGEWKTITIGHNNEPLNKATKHYNYAQ